MRRRFQSDGQGSDLLAMITISWLHKYYEEDIQCLGTLTEAGLSTICPVRTR
jgi:hypothetical protein